ncbi:MAG TPA: tripartite tricarboxylate transporter substrate binding protein [Burkholderiales bacterium]|nr:tripartite tricarboxylate transporter substrate binding protein [Burkholderiales bacterium]
MKLRAAALGLVALGLGTGVMAAGDYYPVRPVTLVIPFPPGTNTDLVARPLAERLTSSLGQPVIVDYRPGGAGGTVGAKAVAKAEPDGYTLLMSPPGPLVVAPVIYKDLGYDPVASFLPVATVFSVPQLLAVHPSIPVHTIEELVRYAKANPGKINFASPGYGTQPHLLGEMLRRSAGIDIVHVAYKGPAQAMTDLVAGQVQMYFETLSLYLPQVRSGRARVLAVADERRSPQLPDVPTTVESGFPTLQGTFWAGIVAPAGTPVPIVQKLNAGINAIVGSAEMQSVLDKISAKPKLGSPEAFAAFMTAEAHRWSDIVRAAGIKAE